MHWKRGFRRVVFVLAVVAAVICAGLSVIVVLSIRSSAQFNLEWEREKFGEKYEIAITKEQALAELKRREALSPEDRAVEEEQRQPLQELREKRDNRSISSTEPNGIKMNKKTIFGDSAITESAQQLQMTDQQKVRLQELRAKKAEFEKEKANAKTKLEELENGFWVSLSKNGLAGICTLVGLVGGLTGFLAIWFIYKLLEWLVLGFCDG